MFKLSHRQQRTIARSAVVTGVGLLNGRDVLARFRPAEPGTGVVFVRSDLPGRPVIPASVTEVTGTARRTTLGQGDAHVTLVEHVMAALAGLRIDNCRVELDGPEPPGLDGSANGFVQTLLEAGIEVQNARKTVWTVNKPLAVKSGGSTLALHPADNEDLTVSYMLDYGPRSPIARQSHTQVINPGEFAESIAGCRTFLLETEAQAFRASGMGERTTARDVLVFGPNGLIENKLRWANEPARHKILDLIGDLALCGLDIRGHAVAYRSGHPLNVQLATELAARYEQATARPARNFFRVAA
ncbi:MAG: UDP-3-O-acyl-N-acetylglucosamine deacetylase [Gemmataceae bacterium]|nr:UDP-3-O-acyl-N-acetylglucosamine deacetylase [Gemmataceae bacterium]